MPSVLLVHAIFVAILIISMPSDAHAWGPGMHVEVALAALSKLVLMAPVVREIVKRFPDSFIYGVATPDIVVGKKYAGYFHHCHNWRMGWLTLQGAKTDSQRAAAYGYLTHLASDVVAHNYYIPVKIVRSWRTRLLTHTYWEMRFDLGVSDEAWKKLDMVTKSDIADFDSILERVLKKTLFSFSTNKRIFNTILVLQKMKGTRKSLKLYAKHSRFEIEKENREHYFDLTMESAMGFLSDPEHAACLDADPAGLAKLAYAKAFRRSLRKRFMQGILKPKKMTGIVEVVKERLAIGLFRPELSLPQLTDIL